MLLLFRVSCRYSKIFQFFFFCAEEALDLLKQLKTSSETNGLIASVKDSLWKVFSNPDYLNM